MHRQFALVILAVPILIASGCSFSAKSPSSARLGEPALVQVFAGRPPRYVAERHKLQVLTSESELQKSWESTASFLRNDSMRSWFLQHHDTDW